MRAMRAAPATPICAPTCTCLASRPTVVLPSISLSRYTGLFEPAGQRAAHVAGAFTEPLACAVYGMKKLAIEPGQFVAIFGPGPMGLMMVQMAKAMGAGKVALIGTRDYRLKEGKQWGADYLFNTKETKSPYYAKNLKEAIADLTHGVLAERAIVPNKLQRGLRAGDRHYRQRSDFGALRPAQHGRCHPRTGAGHAYHGYGNSVLLAGAPGMADCYPYDRGRTG